MKIRCCSGSGSLRKQQAYQQSAAQNAGQASPFSTVEAASWQQQKRMQQSIVSGVLPQLDGMNEASNVGYGSEEETVLEVENEYSSTVSDVCDGNVEDSKVPTTLDVTDENAQEEDSSQ